MSAFDERLDKVAAEAEGSVGSTPAEHTTPIEPAAASVTNDQQDVTLDSDPNGNDDSNPDATDSLGHEVKSTKTDPSEPVVDIADLKSTRDRVATDFPELKPVLDLALKEMERDLQKKYRNLSALQKDTAETLIYDEKLKAIPKEELNGMASMYHTMQNGSPQDKNALADYLFGLSETLRDSQFVTNNQSVPAWKNDPEWQQMQQQLNAHKAENFHNLVNSTFDSLKPEFGDKSIPTSQRDHVMEICRAKNLNINDIPMVWRAEYGVAYAKQEVLKNRQSTAKEKAGLSISSGGAPAPPSTSSAKRLSFEDKLNAICDARGLQ